MSDKIEIVSKHYDQMADANHVPYGTWFPDDEYVQRDETHSIEGLFEGAVPAVDWSGKDQPPAVVKRKPGRPKGSKNKR